MLYLLPENDTLQHICLEMRDYKDKTKEELLEIIRELEEQLASRSLLTDPCPDEEPERFREKYGKEILEAIPDMLTVFDRNLDYIELLSSPDTNHVEGLSGKDKSHPNLKDIVPESEYRKIRANMEKVVRTGFPSIGEHSLQFEGETHHYENLVCPLGDKYLLCMCRDVTSRENAQRELAAARVKAEESDRLKSAFLANMSHEIRTPLNAIVGFSNILALDEDVSQAERLEYIGSINKNSDLLLKLINDILELSRIESGYMSFEYEKCFVSELVDSIYMTHQMLIPEQLEFIKELDAVQVEVMLDKGRLTQVITNFLNNASKFTKTGYIKLGYRYLSESDRVAIYVEDTGRGIELSEQKMIFSRFYKQDEFSQGAGLGLSICQVIVEKLRGKIELWSEPGKGSRFTVVLPVVKATSYK